MLETPLTVLNLYRFEGGADAARAAFAALAARVEREGHPGIRSYRFFVHADQPIARAVIDYAGPSAWLGHHDISMAWPEMRALHGVARLAEVTFLGPFTPEMQAWLDRSGLTARIETGYSFVAGFQRNAAHD
jgi:hypothetical protein